jgi:hypothetical protein
MVVGGNAATVTRVIVKTPRCRWDEKSLERSGSKRRPKSRRFQLEEGLGATTKRNVAGERLMWGVLTDDDE